MIPPAQSRWPYLPELASAQVPRYTSYPPANRFTSDIGETDAVAALSALPSAAELSIYIHVPFCNQLCWYCGCHTSVPTHANPLDAYVIALLQEIDLVSALLDRPRPVRHLHFGGGSPNLLSPEQIDAIFGRLNERFELEPDAEICAEFDPRSVPTATLEAFAGAGLTRASLGVQVLDPHVQSLINRTQPAALVEELVLRLRDAGVDSINMDVLYGLPEQTTAHVLDTVAFAAASRADRIAVFGYAHLPWFKKHQAAIRTSSLPQGEARFRQAEAASQFLTSEGYRRIGMDHFALPGDELAMAANNRTLRRNFQGYTADTAGDLLGFGASAISSLGRMYFQNSPDAAQYRQRAGDGRLATVRGARLTSVYLEIGQALSDLLCNFEADIPDTVAQQSHERVVMLQSLGLLKLEGRHLTVTERGAPYVRNIAAAIDPHFSAGVDRHSLAV